MRCWPSARPTFDAKRPGKRRSDAVTLDQILECYRGVSRCLRADALVVLPASELVELEWQPLRWVVVVRVVTQQVTQELHREEGLGDVEGRVPGSSSCYTRRER